MDYNFYLIDDDVSVLSILSHIIVSHNLGDVVGKSTSGETLLKELKQNSPDIVIIDLLMPKVDGITLVKEIKMEYPQLPVIMISEVQAKDLVSKAYEMGVEYFVHKPINVNEVINVIKRVDEKIQMRNVISSFESAFESIKKLKPMALNEHSLNHVTSAQSQVGIVQSARTILSDLGVLSETGSKDLLMLVDYIFGLYDGTSKRVLDHKMSDFYLHLSHRYEVENGESVHPRSIEQRIRRTIMEAMSHTAAIGNEDFDHDVFIDYAHRLFDFNELRIEMKFQKTKKGERGKVNIKKFISGYMQIIRAQLMM
jgi:two-component system response regulator YcbB